MIVGDINMKNRWVFGMTPWRCGIIREFEGEGSSRTTYYIGWIFIEKTTYFEA